MSACGREPPQRTLTLTGQGAALPAPFPASYAALINRDHAICVRVACKRQLGDAFDQIPRCNYVDDVRPTDIRRACPLSKDDDGIGCHTGMLGSAASLRQPNLTGCSEPMPANKLNLLRVSIARRRVDQVRNAAGFRTQGGGFLRLRHVWKWWRADGFVSETGEGDPHTFDAPRSSRRRVGWHAYVHRTSRMRPRRDKQSAPQLTAQPATRALGGTTSSRDRSTRLRQSTRP